MPLRPIPERLDACRRADRRPRANSVFTGQRLFAYRSHAFDHGGDVAVAVTLIALVRARADGIQPLNRGGGVLGLQIRIILGCVIGRVVGKSFLPCNQI